MLAQSRKNRKNYWKVQWENQGEQSRPFVKQEAHLKNGDHRIKTGDIEDQDMQQTQRSQWRGRKPPDLSANLAKLIGLSQPD